MASARASGQAAGMTTSRPAPVRVSALAAPALMLLYGFFRWIDGMDGDRGPGMAWNVGHSLFLLALVGFGVVAVGLRRLVPPGAGARRAVADTALGAALVGLAGFVSVIVMDLFPRLDDLVRLPEWYFVAAPALFQSGLLTLLVVATTLRPPAMPVWSAVLVLVGFTAVAVDLDLLPVAALCLMGGLAPLTGTGPATATGTGPATATGTGPATATGEATRVTSPARRAD
jgi:hypothetical protein